MPGAIKAAGELLAVQTLAWRTQAGEKAPSVDDVAVSAEERLSITSHTELARAQAHSALVVTWLPPSGALCQSWNWNWNAAVWGWEETALQTLYQGPPSLIRGRPTRQQLSSHQRVLWHLID